MDPSKRQLPNPGSDDTNSPIILDGGIMRSWPRMYGLEGFYAAPPSSDPYVPGIRTNQEAYNNEMGRGISTYGVSRGHVHYQCGDMNPPSDSGYSSRAKHSVADTSVYDGVDRSQDTQSITGHMSDFHPFASMSADKFGQGTNSQREYSHGSWLNQQQPPLSSRPRHDPASNHLVCPTCRQQVKNRSEIKKHEQRHSKPHKCDVPGCGRKEGFSTPNDLDRHKKSVHSQEGTRYQCRIGICSSKDKTWPRADNFRSHLKRVHGQEIPADGDLSEFYVTPPQAPVLEGVGEFAAYGGDFPIMSNNYWDQRPAHIDVPPQNDLDVSEPTSASLSGIFAIQRSQDVADEHQRDRSAAAEECNMTTMASVSPVLMQSTAHLPLAHHIGPFGDRAFSDNVRLESDPLIGSRSGVQDLEADLLPHAVRDGNFVSQQSRPMPLEVESQGSDVIDGVEDEQSAASGANSDTAMMEDGVESVVSRVDEEDDQEERKPSIPALPPITDVEALQEFLLSLPENLVNDFFEKRSMQSQKKAATATVAVLSESPKYTCPNDTCGKQFPRQCELKKHLKRHEKPYGCTFRDCTRTFGSKNDWKRHENSQHAQLETWKCHELDGTTDGTPCSKVFARREQFKNHLQGHHGIQSEQRVEKELNERRIGRDCDSSFWCGFCVEIIFITSKDVHAWTERFNHIDEHFCGKNQDGQRTIAEWKHIDDADVRDANDSASSSASAAATAQASRPGKKRGAENAQTPRSKRLRA
ncbi:hypothetical protein F5X68DRAFT_5979 [Plectosphaerella plurivora]|uniref:C2H2-type domain-containing protein n=1 Tax=Plectosphaerella plurivora TaxID=936078 RepID=A0A9P8VQ70_9PEZI|nr:hypothetical protein F5X68DRAFT_5979 [Plectosphaerella plurivora]